MNRAATLEQLTRLCNLNREGVASPAIEATGFVELDNALPNGGWQSGTIVELMPTEIGIGELRILMPALARITQSERHGSSIPESQGERQIRGTNRISQRGTPSRTGENFWRTDLSGTGDADRHRCRRIHAG